MLLNKSDTQLDMLENNARMRDYEAEDKKKEEEDEKKKKNMGFTQVYKKGFDRLQELIKKDPSSARLYLLISEYMDGYGGLVASQEVLAERLECSRRTIIRLIKKLEDEGALIKIKIGSGVYCYCLDPTEVWKAWDSSKKQAIFNTRTLVSKNDKENQTIQKRLSIMMKQHS